MVQRSSLLSCLFFIFCASLTAEAKIQPAKAFIKPVNKSLLLSGLVENNADYLPLQISNYPFSLCFYNSTPNAFFLGLGMGNANSTSLMRWVWTANPARPVTKNAKLVFGRNGNLVLVDANGRVAWQTHTTNKGVVDIKLLPNGNLVLLNKTGGFVWQSFDHPTHTLLVGQSLYTAKSSNNNKLVNGAYSMVVNSNSVDMFFKSPLSSKPLHYYTLAASDGPSGTIYSMIFRVAPDSEGPEHANELRFDIMNDFFFPTVWAQPKYNSTLSILRFSSDGNIHVYTYYEKGILNAWEETYTLFTDSQGGADECYLPEKCGSLGICENSQCVACPTAKGLEGWSKDCKPSKLPSCNSTTVGYYKVEGVDHFLNIYNAEAEPKTPMKIEECRKKCSNDCKCAAFFYKKDSESCLLTVQLNTLKKGDDSESSKLVAYIKYTK